MVGWENVLLQQGDTIMSVKPCWRCTKKTTKSAAPYEVKLPGEQVAAELWRFPDRTSPTGKMVDSYLRSQSELDDAAVHLLFSANRWEKR